MASLEITKMLIMSTAHIKEETGQWLNRMHINDIFYSMIVYNKDNFGWFIYIEKGDLDDEKNNMPLDLYDCLKFAVDCGCTWLCLDGDANIVSLPRYEWE